MLPRTPPALAALLARVSRTELTPGSACRAGTLCRPGARGSARASPSPSPSPPAHIATALARRRPRRRLVRASPPPSPSPSPWTAGGAGAASPRGRALSLAPLATRHPAAQTATARAEGRAAAHPRLSHSSHHRCHHRRRCRRRRPARVCGVWPFPCVGTAGGRVWLPGRSQATRRVDISMNATSPPRARSDIRAGPRGAFLRSEGLSGVRC